jgi:hypothetical protein
VATSESWFPEVRELWAKLQDAWHGEAKQWVFGRLPSDHVLDGQEAMSDREVVASDEYVGISLRSLWIVNTRNGWQKYYPALHAFVAAPAFMGDDVEFHVLTTPANLKELSAQGLDKVIAGNQRLLGPVPYWGGKLRLELALFAIESANLAAPFLSVLGDLSSAAGGAFATTALAFAKPLTNGIALLTNGSGNSLEIGYFADAETPRTGYYVAIRAEGIALDNLWLKQGYLVDGTGTPLRDAPYFVFSVDAVTSRPDWRRLPGLEEAWNAVTTAGREGDTAKVDTAYARVKRLINSSDDLVTRQMQEIVTELDRRVAQLKSGNEAAIAPSGDGLGAVVLPSLRGVSEAATGFDEIEPVAVPAPA